MSSRRVMGDVEGLRRGSSAAMPAMSLGLWLFVACCLCSLSSSSGAALDNPVAAAASATVVAAAQPSSTKQTPESYDSTLRRRRQQQQASLAGVGERMTSELDTSQLQSALRKLGLWLLEQAEALQQQQQQQQQEQRQKQQQNQIVVPRPLDVSSAYQLEDSGETRRDQVGPAEERSKGVDVAQWEELHANYAQTLPRPWKKNFVKISNLKWSKSSGGSDY